MQDQTEKTQYEDISSLPIVQEQRENEKRYKIRSVFFTICCTIWFMIAFYFSLYLGMLAASGSSYVLLEYYLGKLFFLVPPVLVGFLGKRALKKKYKVHEDNVLGSFLRFVVIFMVFVAIIL